jgi:hypothetical protein
MARSARSSQAWVSAEASLPSGWQMSGLWRFDGSWVSLSEGGPAPPFAQAHGLGRDPLANGGRVRADHCGLADPCGGRRIDHQPRVLEIAEDTGW